MADEDIPVNSTCIWWSTEQREDNIHWFSLLIFVLFLCRVDNKRNDS